MARVPKSRADVQLFAEIGAIGQLARNRIERALPAGMSYAQFMTLVHLARDGAAAGPAALARSFQLTKGAMTNTLQRLEARGFVRVEGHVGDGRRKRVTITETGLAAHRAALAATRPTTDALRKRFSNGDFAAALPFLSDLRAWLDENR
jgi:DNA-binding MarR family transcriptional regulator